MERYMNRKEEGRISNRNVNTEQSNVYVAFLSSIVIVSK
jgi:hypothetical protein